MLSASSPYEDHRSTAGNYIIGICTVTSSVFHAHESCAPILLRTREGSTSHMMPHLSRSPKMTPSPSEPEPLGCSLKLRAAISPVRDGG